MPWLSGVWFVCRDLVPPSDGVKKADRKFVVVVHNEGEDPLEVVGPRLQACTDSSSRSGSDECQLSLR